MKHEKSGLEVTADKVLVKLRKVEEKTSGGIILAQQVVDKEQVAQQMGDVCAYGTTAHEYPEFASIDVGDIILFQRYSGVHFPVDGESYWIMRARDVLGKTSKLPDFVIKGAESSLSAFGSNMQKVA